MLGTGPASPSRKAARSLATRRVRPKSGNAKQGTSMHRNPSRPMSPHLTIWKWGPHMLASILNRVTGVGLAVVGGALLVWWLLAAAQGPDSYADFAEWAAW